MRKGFESLGRSRGGIGWQVKASVSALACCLLMGTANAATIIENFDGKVLDPNVWRGGWFTNNALEVRRRVNKGELLLSLYSRAGTTSNGGRVNVKNEVIPVDSIIGNLTQVAFDVVPLQAAARHCVNGDQDSRARLGMTVTWINDGSSTGSGDETGNIASFLELRGNPGNSKDMEIKPEIWRCNNSSCSSKTYLNLSGTQTLGRVHYGFKATMRMEYDAASNQVNFSTVTPTASYQQSASLGATIVPGPAVNPIAVLEARTEVDNCDLSVAGVQTPFAQIKANVLRVRMDTN